MQRKTASLEARVALAAHWRFPSTMRMTLLALGLVLSACAAGGERTSPSYEAGFSDGCATASAQSSALPRMPQRNEVLYARDPDYRAGWISGQATCRMTSGPPRR